MKPPAQAGKNLEQAQRLLAKIDEPMLAELFRRAKGRTEPDGFPTGGSGGGSSSGITDSTASAALRRIMGNPSPDPVRKSVEEAFAIIAMITKYSIKLDHKIQVVLNTAASKRGREITIDLCLACQCDVTGVGEDRIKSGYCPACYRKWLRDGRPDRHRFEKSRRPDDPEPE